MSRGRAASDRGHARDPARDSHDPNVLRATASLAGSDHNEDGSSMPPHRADGPSGRLPIDSDARSGPSSRRPKRSLDLEGARAARNATAAVRFRRTPRPAPRQEWRERLPTLRHISNSVSFLSPDEYFGGSIEKLLPYPGHPL
jgi:hypothetical protein